MTGLHALVLAGGAGARFGGDKLTAPWRGGLLIEGALTAAFAAPVDCVTVVTGAGAPAVEAAVRAFAVRTGQRSRLAVVHAADHAEGMAASLRAGVGALPQQATGVLVFLGDMPLVPASLAMSLAAALAGGAPAAVPVLGGQRGHPAALSRGLFAQVLALEGDRGARGLLDALGPRLVEVPASDDGILIDVDRPEDLHIHDAI